jgi:hypothetical protein
MGDLIIKPASSGSLKVHDQGGTERISMNTSGVTTFSANVEISTTDKIKQKGAFMQSSTHQALVLGS